MKLSPNMYKFLLMAVFLLHFDSSIAAQDVGGMIVEYRLPFEAKEAKARTWHGNMPTEMQSMIQGFEVFEAGPSLGLGEVRVLKIRYVPKVSGNLNMAAQESIQNILRLPGIKNSTQNITAVKVSGLEARRISFATNRYDGKLGAEFLIVYDKKTNTLFQLQVIFSKRKSLDLSGDLDLDLERAFANNIVASARMANP